MKAILIRVLPETATLPARVKVISQGLTPCHYTVESDAWNCTGFTPAQAVRRYMAHYSLNWGSFKVGTLPSGEHVAAFGSDYNGI